MRKLVLAVLTLFVLGAIATAHGQTTTNYPIPSGTICNASGPEHCTYYPDGVARFQTGDPWTQFVYNSSNADYCFDFAAYQSTAVWTVTDTPADGATAKLFTLNCASTDIQVPAVHGTIHAEIHAYSYLVSYRSCSRSGCRTLYRTEWAVLNDSFVEVTK